ncbi:hypothetical protein AK88_00714 [Plasmodium fragile]|uniref:Uncharacterized protein n=1 Tax=Plasmodium fragile TaxID=5857 RepID=A0A0D9QR06_PLAFR|nr:uncharacterized protein AK88_00714 [Plasmodium fragile]KJP89504.1 hypothetical protein AK88_00714 [Plasmodium fragile]
MSFLSSLIFFFIPDSSFFFIPDSSDSSSQIVSPYDQDHYYSVLRLYCYVNMSLLSEKKQLHMYKNIIYISSSLYVFHLFIDITTIFSFHINHIIVDYSNIYIKEKVSCVNFNYVNFRIHHLQKVIYDSIYINNVFVTYVTWIFKYDVWIPSYLIQNLFRKDM